MEIKNKQIDKLLMPMVFIGINLMSTLLILLPKLGSLIWLSDGIIDHISDEMGYLYLSIFGVLLSGIPLLVKEVRPQLLTTVFASSMLACLIALFGGFYTDIYFLLKVAKYNGNAAAFSNGLVQYLNDNTLYYSLVIMLIIGLLISYRYYFKISLNKSNTKLMQMMFVVSATALPILLLMPLPLMNIHLVQYFHSYYLLPPVITLIGNVAYGILSFIVLTVAFKFFRNTKDHLKFLVKLTNFMGGFSSFVLVFEIINIIVPYLMLKRMQLIQAKSVFYYAGIDLKAYGPTLGMLLVFTLVLLGLRKYMKKLQFDDSFEVDNAGSEHGGAKWATKEDITEYGYYNKENQIYSGLDEHGNRLYLPLTNRTLVAPPGAGKTSTVVIPFLLQYNGPIFAMDLKCELFPVTARNRHDFGRMQCAIDPFNVIQDNPAVYYKSDFTRKPEKLFNKIFINPFLEIPTDPRYRQRVLQSLAHSFIVRDSEGGNSEHFYKLCESFISGSIDYILKAFPSEQHNFKTLLKLSHFNADEFNKLLEDMLSLGGEAANAASDIQRAGKDEKGGILTTVSNQLKWLLDINMQELLGSSNFSISEFIKGNCDIYLILPPYAVQSHGRLIRMMLSLICEAINMNTNNTCGKKYVFLLDELAQLGKSEEIEKLIEVYRTYNVVLWSIFQSSSQIASYNKPDLFKDPGQGGVLQFFKTKNLDTMKWIQEVFGKRTILQKTLSTNKGSQNQKNQLLGGGSVSSGEGESVNSGGVDLVQIDEIREMPKDEQWFLIDDRPIKSKKIPYYKDSYFNGKWDINPFEISNYKFVSDIERKFGKLEDN